ncbi:MAG: glycosyltransferase [Planctomycetota bacterium]
MSHTPCECSIIIPTRNRASVLDRTLDRLAHLPDSFFEVIICDNGSTDGTLDLKHKYPRVRWVELGANLACAARNVGASAARGWLLLMLDDDSWPEPGAIDAMVRQFRSRVELGAAALRVRLADLPHRHDAGGTSGVFFNCGAAIRRRAFLDVGGYPIDYQYYVEEYDLCCRLWQAGWVVEPCGDVTVWHARVARNRDNNRMVQLLIRNNVKLWSRYAPESLRAQLIDATYERYERVARKEGAIKGFDAVREACGAIPASKGPSRPLTVQQYERLMGLDRARAALSMWADKHHVKKVALWTRGKACESLIALLYERSIHVEAVHDDIDGDDIWHDIPLRPATRFNPMLVDGIVVGSLSCGVAEDISVELVERFPALPILCPASYGSFTATPLAIPA